MGILAGHVMDTLARTSIHRGSLFRVTVSLSAEYLKGAAEGRRLGQKKRQLDDCVGHLVLHHS
jgi:hypothetical protein